MFRIVHVGIDPALQHHDRQTVFNRMVTTTTDLEYQREPLRLRVGLVQRPTHQHVQEPTCALVSASSERHPRAWTDVGICPM